MTRKSTSGGVLRLGSHLIKSWSKDQHVIATSSGEAELYAVNKVASESLGIQSILRDLGYKADITIEIDAKATLGMISRNGLGKMRHLDVAELWLQEAVRNKRFRIKKVPGADNTSDILTKHVAKDLCERHCASLGLVFGFTS